MDPTKELARLVGERKYEEAFTAALHRSDVSIVSWLCSQVCRACGLYLQYAVVQCFLAWKVRLRRVCFHIIGCFS